MKNALGDDRISFTLVDGIDNRDSLIKKIQLDLDSTNIDFQKIYIDAQRINNGH